MTFTDISKQICIAFHILRTREPKIENCVLNLIVLKSFKNYI